MDRQKVFLDWDWRMQLESALTDIWLPKGDLGKARQRATGSLDVALAPGERTWHALAWETNARVAIAGSDVARAQECIAHALSTINGAELPLAAWRINVTAVELFDRTGDRGSAANHRELSRAVVLELANSLPVDEPLRHAFLSAGAVKNLFAFGESGRTQEGSVCDKV